MGKDNANIIKILAKNLKKLSKGGLKDFTAALCDIEPPKGFSQIQRNHLEEKTATQITKFIMKSYTNRHAPAKVREALKNIHENQIRTDLEKELREESKATNPTGKAKTSGGAANRKQVEKKNRGKDGKPKRTRRQSTSDEEHFVDQNRKNLIDRITNVEPVLDALLAKKLLTQEQYDIIRDKDPNQAKVRELFCQTLAGFERKEKDTLRDIMKKHNPVVINNLLDKSKAKKK